MIRLLDRQAPIRLDLLGLSSGFVLVLGLQAYFIVHYTINWDEFYFLSLIHDAQQDRLNNPLRTIHVHLFSWVTSLPGNEIQQVIAGRAGMFVAQLLTVVSVVVAARKFVSMEIALFAGLAWLASGFTLTHGFSFRTDPLAAALLMGAIAFTLTPNLTVRRAILAGSMVGLAGLVTIKAVLYLPAFVGVLVWHLSRGGRAELIAPIMSGVVAAFICFAVLYVSHSASLGGNVSENIDGNASFAGRAWRSMLLDTSLLPQSQMFQLWLLFSVTTVVLLLIGSTRGVVAILFAAPLLSVLFYRNSFAYFYPFITAPAMITLALGARFLLRASPINFYTVCILMAPTFLLFAAREWPKDQTAQREVLAAVHEMFPEPVPYIDRNSMVSSFPKQGFFMTSWGLQNYFERGEPVMDDILASRAPPLLIANSPALENAFLPGADFQLLFTEDVHVLRSAYLPYWGPVHVAGFEVGIPPAAREAEQNVWISGAYRLESEESMRINDTTYDEGDVVRLRRGKHFFRSDTAHTARFVWSEAGEKPISPPSAQPLYFGF